MANQEHLDILKQGVEVWNQWQKEHILDLSKADLSDANFIGADLSGTDFRGVDLSYVNLIGAKLTFTNFTSANLRSAILRAVDLRGADLRGAKLMHANLINANLVEAKLDEAWLRGARLNGANLRGANLRGANLKEADLSNADLRGANLNGANLSEVMLVRTNFAEATLTNCNIYGIAAWDVQLHGAEQINLIITPEDQPTITVDNLKVAQFIYLLLNNAEIRDVIDTIAKKAVLILGRFTPERKAVLDAIRDELRKLNYTPILFDFEKPVSRDFTETMRTLAHLARFIIADLTEPSSIPQELQAIIPDLEVPVQPVLLEAKREYSMFVDFRKYHWVLPIYLYKDQASLMASVQNEIVEPAEKKTRELAIEKAKRLERP